jgi:hypothetical protein
VTWFVGVVHATQVKVIKVKKLLHQESNSGHGMMHRTSLTTRRRLDRVSSLIYCLLVLFKQLFVYYTQVQC